MQFPCDTDAGAGHRARLGVVLLETDETLEPEFRRLMDIDGVTLHHNRIPMVPDVSAESLARMEADLPAAAALLPLDPPLDVIGYACTSAATVIGSVSVARAIQTACPDAVVTDPLAAVIAATRKLGVNRIGFLSPYVQDVSSRMRHRLEDAGLRIAGLGSFGQSDDRVVARITEASIANAALQVAQPPCDAVFIACTNLRCLRVIPEIEAQIGKPVLSSNQVLAWHMLRLAGISERRPGLGLLFEQA